MHLGFFSTEDQAARAYDRAAINKGARDNGKITVNFPISDYTRELETLRRITQEELVAALANEQCALAPAGMHEAHAQAEARCRRCAA